MQTAISIDDLDLTKSCEDGFEFEVTDDGTGKGAGIFLTVVGAHAPVVLDWTKKALNQRRKFDDMQERRGKKGQIRTIEEDIEFGTEATAIRVTSWRGPGQVEGLTTEQLTRFRGIAEPCTHANVIKLCTINPPIKEQILKASEDLTNFT